MNYDHITRQTYRRNSYEQFLLDSGDREERTYVDGQLEGDATVIGTNGDRLEFKYKESKRRGAAV